MPSCKKTETIDLPAELLADIEAVAPSRKRGPIPDEIKRMVMFARDEKRLPWAEITRLIKKHYPEYDLSKSSWTLKYKEWTEEGA